MQHSFEVCASLAHIIKRACLGLLAGDPDCLHIPGLTVEKGNTYTLVVSDKDDLDAVLPVSVIEHLKV